MARTLSKPAGIPTLRPHSDPDGDCVLARLLAQEPARAHLPWPEGFPGGILHRLDISTSGAVWVADTPEELGELRALFEAGRLVKTYRFLAAKDVPWEENVLRRPVAHDRRKKRRMVVQRGPHTPHRGKWYPAETRFRRLGGRLWQAQITTGVTHQIRVHAAFVGLPLLGDALYGGGSAPPHRPDRAPFCLHHMGLRSPDGHATEAVACPEWAALPTRGRAAR